MSGQPVPRRHPVDPSAAFSGVEFSTFRIAAGADRAAVQQASERVRREYLARQPGFVDHILLADGEGGYAELVYASSRESAIDICEGFMAHPAGLAYREVMEPRSARLSFWRRL